MYIYAKLCIFICLRICICLKQTQSFCILYFAFVTAKLWISCNGGHRIKCTGSFVRKHSSALFRYLNICVVYNVYFSIFFISILLFITLHIRFVILMRIIKPCNIMPNFIPQNNQAGKKCYYIPLLILEIHDWMLWIEVYDFETVVHAGGRRVKVECFKLWQIQEIQFTEFNKYI